MDPHRVIEALSATVSPEKQSEGEKVLSEMHKIIGFVPTLLRIVLEENVDVSVRQASAVYFKNMVSQWWKEREAIKPEDPIPFSIHEQDRESIRQAITNAIVVSPAPLQAQLKVALSKIIRLDFPAKFAILPERIKNYLSSQDHSNWHGALVCLYALVEAHEHRKQEDRATINATMRVFFPILHAHMTSLISDQSDHSLCLQVLILKIFFAFINLHFPMDVMDQELVGRWVDVFRVVLGDFTKDDKDPCSSWWKRKKWALRILNHIFTKYGTPGVVIKKYQSFAEWYVKSFSEPVLTVLLNICEVYRQKNYVAPRILSETLGYFSTALGQSFAWKFLRSHFSLLVREVIFPLLCHSEEDDELWHDDPIEYIRLRASRYCPTNDPSDAAFTLLSEACSKRRGVLDNLMPFCIHMLNSATPREKDGVLHMYGTIAGLLLKKKAYKSQLEPFLSTHVLPVFQAPEGYRRARACWLLGRLSRAEFDDPTVLVQAAEAARHAMCNDTELPVRVFAAICLFDFLNNQQKVSDLLLPHLQDLLLQLLKLLRETEFDDLNQVIDKIIMTYEDEVMPIAVELTTHLSGTFMQLMNVAENGVADGDKTDERGDADDDNYDYRSVVATGVLDNIQSILSRMEDHIDIMNQLEPVIVQTVHVIFKRSISIFYEEALGLVLSLTSKQISPALWQVYEWIYDVFQKDAGDCFSEMMAPLHNYITVDRQAFLSDPKRLEILSSACSEVLQTDSHGEDAQLHAAKLLEVLLLDYRGQIDSYVTKFIELALTRLTRPLVTSELRTMCIQIVVASLLYSPTTVLPIVCEHHWPGTDVPILAELMKLWLRDADCFLGLHDRRLCVLGLCLLLSLPTGQRPAAVDAMHQELIPTLLLLFSGLKRAYAVKAQDQADDDDSSDEEETDDEEDIERRAMDSDEDEIDEDSVQYLEMLESNDEDDDDDDDDDDNDDDEETVLESFDTDLDKPECEMDEYVTFYLVMTELERSDAAWYHQLVGGLNADQLNALKTVVDTAVKCIQQKESKMIEQAGGYTFQTTIPSNFNFGTNQQNPS